MHFVQFLLNIRFSIDIITHPHYNKSTYKKSFLKQYIYCVILMYYTKEHDIEPHNDTMKEKTLRLIKWRCMRWPIIKQFWNCSTFPKAFPV